MFSDMITVKTGKGLYLVEASAIYLGKDISICIGGGTKPHIGAVSLAVYEPVRNSATVSTVTVHTHRDDAVAAYFAKIISREMKCTVSVSAGLHVDDATDDDIRKLWEKAKECCTCLIEALKATEGK